MSAAATGWAYRQKIPIKPKMVLAALADQTDERTGKVCYGKTDIGYLCEKASAPERSLYRYLAALERNGYLIRQTGRGRNHTNEYWLCLDRELASSIDEWTWAAAEQETQDVDEKPATVAGYDDRGKPANGGRENLPSVAEQESLVKLKNQRPPDEKPLNGFSRSAQDVDRKKSAPVAASPADWVFVIEGTRWWSAMERYYRRTRGRWVNSTTRGTGEHQGKSGHYFRRADLDAALKTGPPNDGVDDQAADEFAKVG